MRRIFAIFRRPHSGDMCLIHVFRGRVFYRVALPFSVSSCLLICRDQTLKHGEIDGISPFLRHVDSLHCRGPRTHRRSRGGRQEGDPRQFS